MDKRITIVKVEEREDYNFNLKRTNRLERITTIEQRIRGLESGPGERKANLVN